MLNWIGRQPKCERMRRMYDFGMIKTLVKILSENIIIAVDRRWNMVSITLQGRGHLTHGFSGFGRLWDQLFLI